MKARVMLLCLNLIAVPPVTAQSGPSGGASWLVGCWELQSENSRTIEIWFPAVQNELSGQSKTMRGSQLVASEELRIHTQAGRLTYTAHPAGQRQTDFTATMVTDTLLVFENPAHDFPRRIVYRRSSADSLHARIEGPGSSRVRSIDFRFRRVACPPK